ncbi:hypothetical protein BCR33DRAFT_741929 [Rhizoclosmatium globosum]|uniref:Uncharacterized protein n=1 Tax=Rhizoclosmatium globosum TaxID=329046 RepID=A0A1Y2BT36_9FUNG|nr:hypothetical protein BCR33DRAFT_741929 [Rhizoclosmatium globosum]|eukprot:ORY37922.1 hypothetical protein BCR33DRAFT_741929 [Rhizoclosmatium globosum]
MATTTDHQKDSYFETQTLKLNAHGMRIILEMYQRIARGPLEENDKEFLHGTFISYCKYNYPQFLREVSIRPDIYPQANTIHQLVVKLGKDYNKLHPDYPVVIPATLPKPSKTKAPKVVRGKQPKSAEIVIEDPPTDETQPSANSADLTADVDYTGLEGMLGETSLSREPMEVDGDDLDLSVDPVTANTVDPVTTTADPTTTATTVPLETPIVAGSSSSEPVVTCRESDLNSVNTEDSPSVLVEMEVDQDVPPQSPKGKAVLKCQDVDVQPLDVPVPVVTAPAAEHSSATPPNPGASSRPVPVSEVDEIVPIPAAIVDAVNASSKFGDFLNKVYTLIRKEKITYAELQDSEPRIKEKFPNFKTDLTRKTFGRQVSVNEPRNTYQNSDRESRNRPSPNPPRQRSRSPDTSPKRPCPTDRRANRQEARRQSNNLTTSRIAQMGYDASTYDPYHTFIGGLVGITTTLLAYYLVRLVPMITGFLMLMESTKTTNIIGVTYQHDKEFWETVRRIRLSKAATPVGSTYQDIKDTTLRLLQEKHGEHIVRSEMGREKAERERQRAEHERSEREFEEELRRFESDQSYHGNNDQYGSGYSHGDRDYRNTRGSTSRGGRGGRGSWNSDRGSSSGGMTLYTMEELLMTSKIQLLPQWDTEAAETGRSRLFLHFFSSAIRSDGSIMQFFKDEQQEIQYLEENYSDVAWNKLIVCLQNFKKHLGISHYRWTQPKYGLMEYLSMMGVVYDHEVVSTPMETTPSKVSGSRSRKADFLDEIDVALEPFTSSKQSSPTKSMLAIANLSPEKQKALALDIAKGQLIATVNNEPDEEDTSSTDGHSSEDNSRNSKRNYSSKKLPPKDSDDDDSSDPESGSGSSNNSSSNSDNLSSESEVVPLKGPSSPRKAGGISKKEGIIRTVAKLTDSKSSYQLANNAFVSLIESQNAMTHSFNVMSSQSLIKGLQEQQPPLTDKASAQVWLEKAEMAKRMLSHVFVDDNAFVRGFLNGTKFDVNQGFSQKDCGVSIFG